MKTVAITGASGYIGRHLVAALKGVEDIRIKVLSRSRPEDCPIEIRRPGIEIFQGDLCNLESLRGFLEPGCSVVNLVYLWEAGEQRNLAATTHLLDACRDANAGRLIHCSTAAVVGRTRDDLVTENTPCRPVTDYGITKLKVEHAVLEAARTGLDAAILRPTSVFGPGGAPLKKLADDLAQGSRFRNYLKSCLFGERQMNLVHVTNVVAAIVFLLERTESLGGQVYIVSDDDSPSNKFADVERVLMREFGVPYYRSPRVQVPLGVLQSLLHCLGRNNTNPRCRYRSAHLAALGFRSPVRFDTALTDYARWYRAGRLDDQRQVAQ